MNDKVFQKIFLSTLSLRRATSVAYILSIVRYISIHALLAESDCLRTRQKREKNHFYPRSPCGERLVRVKAYPLEIFISIHALLAESDIKREFRRTDTEISIHALLAESDIITLSSCMEREISIHALLAESDTGGSDPAFGTGDFYPRSPCGERQLPGVQKELDELFLSTLSLRRATQVGLSLSNKELFLSTLSLRRATEGRN